MSSEIIEGYRLSPQQERVWLLQQGTQHTPYRALCVIQISGNLRPEVLGEALAFVVSRHEILRTTFHLLPGMSIPVQAIADNAVPEIVVCDLRGLCASEQALEFGALWARALNAPFNFEEGLLRLSLATLEEDRYLLTIALPALCGDRVALENLACEISRVYEACIEESELSDEPMQYADVSEILNELIESEGTKAGRAYWQTKDFSAFQTVRLACEQQQSNEADFNPRVISSTVDAETSLRIASLARQHESTTSTLLLACWQVLLRRLTGQADIVVGTLYDCRTFEELNETLGLFAKHLPVSVHLEAGARFDAVLREVDSAAREVHKWQEYFTWELFDSTDSPSFFPFAFEFAEPSRTHLSAGVSFSIVERQALTDRFKIKLLCRQVGDTLHTEFHYDANLYNAEDIMRLSGQFQRLLQSVVANPAASIERLEILTDEERRQLLDQWNDTASDYSPEICIHRLFEAQAERTPERIALVCEGEQVSYGELNRRANQVAHFLGERGVGPDLFVGIMMERSIDLVVALLGVLKAGGAYVPLDPDYPRERLRFMLADAQPALLLTQQHLVESLAGEWQGQLICIDSEWNSIAQSAEQNPVVAVTAHNLAYVIYTSGSSGQPKGVMVPHRAIANRLLWMQQELPLEASDRVLQKTAFSFDASIWEFFVPLLAGAQVELARPGGQQESGYLAAVMAEREITILQVVPTMLEVLLEEERWARCKSLRRVYCGGERLSEELTERFYERLGERQVELHNLYGPTEAAIDATHWECERGSKRGSVPIGRPLANVEVYVLGPELEAVPVGVAGELYIGGVGLARGYWRRPELTADRFIPHPYSAEEGARLYRTGDLARYAADGAIEYLGRVDHQVKVRGFRIELGEVESALRSHPGVREAVVVARANESGSRLVAYVVANEQQALTTNELRNYLSQTLPEYMVPSIFVKLDEMPLTPNGKLDRLALPPAEMQGAEREENYRAPRTATEEILAGMWSHLLKVGPVGIADNFFDLGGHSLLATQLVSWIRESFGVEVPLRKLFESPTVSGLAEIIESEKNEQRGLQCPPIEPVSRDGHLPLSFAQQRLWFLHQLDPASTVYNVPAIVRLIGQLDVGALEQALNEIVRRHEVLRTRFETVERQGVQVIAPDLQVQIAVTDLSAVDDAERVAAELMVEEARQPFDLSTTPLLRARLLRLGAEQHLALLTLHHIISDGWSMSILIGELATLYQAYRQGEESPLNELRLQYADYAVWQREWLQGRVLEEELSYWREQLSGAPPVLQLPADNKRPEQPSYRGKRHEVRVSAEESDRLRELSRSEGVTLFMLLLAVYEVLLSYLTGADDVVVGTDVANRTRAETEGMIGFFVNQLVLRVKVAEAESFRELVRRVREVALAAYEHQDVPFEKVVEAVRPQRSVSYAPLFQVKFTLNNAPVSKLTLSGVEIRQEEVTREALDLDVYLEMFETPDGLSGWINYSTDLFEASTIASMATSFQTLLSRSITQPDATVAELKQMLIEINNQQQATKQKSREASKLEKFKKIKPVAVNLQQAAVVRTSNLKPNTPLPLFIEPEAADVDVVEWARDNRSLLENYLSTHGGIVFRGFAVESAVQMERLSLTICHELFHENGEHRRGTISNNVYTPVFYPRDQQLLWHNENSFNHRWPTRIWFCCVKPALRGGETPVVDSRRVYEMLDPKLRARFMEKGVMYVRNYGGGLGLDWQDVFQTKNRREVEEKCTAANMEFEWKKNGELRTRCVRPAAVKHPRTREWTWFNQAQHWHVSCLDEATRESTRKLFREEDMPRNCYYGNGTRIADEDMASILEVYRQLEVSFPWQRGDVMVLDNLLAAHGRNRFEGERQLLVTMGDMRSYSEV